MDFTTNSQMLCDKYNEVQVDNGRSYGELEKEFNEIFLKVLESSKKEGRYFSGAPLDVYKVHLKKKFLQQEKESIDFDPILFYEKEYNETSELLSTEYYPNNYAFYLPILNKENKSLFIGIIRKRLNYLEDILCERGIKVESSDGGYRSHYFIKDIEQKIKFFKSLENKTEIASEENNGKKDIPYKIALLKEIGFFELPLIKEMTKVNQRKIIQQLIGGTDRQIKGNINVLNPHSQDDRIRYTSGNYEKEVKHFFSSLNQK